MIPHGSKQKKYKQTDRQFKRHNNLQNLLHFYFFSPRYWLLQMWLWVKDFSLRTIQKSLTKLLHSHHRKVFSFFFFFFNIALIVTKLRLFLFLIFFLHCAVYQTGCCLSDTAAAINFFQMASSWTISPIIRVLKVKGIFFIKES